MSTLVELNSYSDGVINYTDVRGSDVIFSFPTAVDLTDQDITQTTFTIQRTIDIVEIIQPTLALVTFSIDVSSLSGATVSFPGTTPSGVVISESSGVYTVSGIDSVGDWNFARNAEITLTGDTQGSFFYQCTIAYTQAGSRRTKEWEVGNFKAIANLQGVSSVTCNTFSSLTHDATANPIVVLSVNDVIYELAILARTFVDVTATKIVDASATMSSQTSMTTSAQRYGSFSNITTYVNPQAGAFSTNNSFGSPIAAHSNEEDNRINTSPNAPGWSVFIAGSGYTNYGGATVLFEAEPLYSGQIGTINQFSMSPVVQPSHGHSKAFMSKYWGGFVSGQLKIYRIDGGDGELSGGAFSFSDSSTDNYANMSGWSSNDNYDVNGGFVGGTLNPSGANTTAKIWEVNHSQTRLDLKHTITPGSSIGFTYISEDWIVIGGSGQMFVYDMPTATLQRTISISAGRAVLYENYLYKSDGTVIDVSTGTTVTTLGSLGNSGDSIAVSDQYVAIGDKGNAVYIYDRNYFNLVKTINSSTATNSSAKWADAGCLAIVDDVREQPNQTLIVGDPGTSYYDSGSGITYTNVGSVYQYKS